MKEKKNMYRKSIATFLTLAGIAAVGVAYEQRAESAARMADKVVGAGTAGRIAKWTDVDTIGDSVISEDGSGRVGIGAAPNINTRMFVFTNSSELTSSAIVGNNTGPGRAITGSSVGGIGVNGIGVVGINGITPSTNPNDAGVRGIAQFGPGTAKAGLFMGDVDVIGTLTKSAGSFRIDHPLDPENKYLSHSFVESPDMMNIYNGTINTDARGNATVTLPNYFEALNRDFRYQLTVVGAEFAQAIVSEKIRGNAFKIRTDKPGVEVSWQVTGVRKDKFAEDHRIQVEADKPVDARGKH